MCSITRIVYLVVLSTFFGSSVQCFLNPFSYFSRYNSAPAPAQVQPQPQPITFEVPKNSVSDLSKMLQQNPDFLKEAIAKSQNANGQPVAIAPRGYQLNYGPSNVEPVSTSAVTTRGLPSETYINGQKFVLTNRLNLLTNRLPSFPSFSAPSFSAPSFSAPSFSSPSFSHTSYTPNVVTYTTHKPNAQSQPEESESYTTEETIESDENDKKQPRKKDNKNKDSNSESVSGSVESPGKNDKAKNEKEKDDKAKNEIEKNGNKKVDDPNKSYSSSWESVSGSSEGV